MKNKTIQAVITKSACPYVPLNVPCNVVLDKNGLPYAIHRTEDGAGTFLFSKWDKKSVIYTQI